MLVMSSNYHHCVELGKPCAELTEGLSLPLHCPSQNSSSENTLCKGLGPCGWVTSVLYIRTVNSPGGALSTSMHDGWLPSTVPYPYLQALCDMGLSVHYCSNPYVVTDLSSLPYKTRAALVASSVMSEASRTATQQCLTCT